MLTRTAALVCAGAILLHGASDQLNQRLKQIFDSKTFTAERFGPTRWLRGGAAFTTLENSATIPGSKDIVGHDAATGKKQVLVSAEQLKPANAQKPLTIEGYTWDKDLNRLLVFTESKRTWRTNSRGDYWLLDRKANTLKKLGGDAPPSSLMFAKFSPDGSRVAYVRGNNLYTEDLTSGEIRRVTTDGSDTIVNGTSDWVYEEELNLRDGFRWAPDGRSIAFWQFDVSGAEKFALINDTDSLYPKITYIPYPKAGTRNAAVRIGVVKSEGGPVRWMNIPGDPRENYLFRLDWVDAGRVAIGQLNRKQNHATVYVADAASGEAKAVFHDEDKAWVDVPEGQGSNLSVEGFDWMPGRKTFAWQSDRDGWRRSYLASIDGSDPKPVTPAGMDIVSVKAFDPEGRWMYFLAAPENATQRHLYRVAMDGSAKPERLSPADQPGSHNYSISPDCRWAIHTYSRFDTPPLTELVSLPDHKSLRVLEANTKMKAAVAQLDEPPVEFFNVTTASGIRVDGWLMRPKNFDASKKYPLVVYVYGEPANTTVVDTWQGNRGLFHRALADEGYLVASFDNRGTPSPKGREWRKAIYGAVGVLSTKDQTEAVQALEKERPYVDPARVGVWGWSGGGSNTLNLMFRSPDVYRVGVSVAPVPDQKLYDTIYQERYMGLPQENAEGYKQGSPLNFAEGLRGDLLIVHGSGDDNVHYQGTEKLVNRLVELGKPFDLMAYPNRSHGISEGKGTSLHVHSLIARYLTTHLPAGPK